MNSYEELKEKKKCIHVAESKWLVLLSKDMSSYRGSQSLRHPLSKFLNKTLTLTLCSLLTRKAFSPRKKDGFERFLIIPTPKAPDFATILLQHTNPMLRFTQQRFQNPKPSLQPQQHLLCSRFLASPGQASSRFPNLSLHFRFQQQHTTTRLGENLRRRREEDTCRGGGGGSGPTKQWSGTVG